MSKKNNNGLVSFLITLIIILFALIMTFVVLNSMNPERFKQALNTVTEVAQNTVNSVKESIYGKPVVKDNIEFPDEEKLTEAQKYYYYQQLSETGKKIYLTIEKNIENIKNGEDNIPLPPSLNDDAKSHENGKEYIAKEFQNAWDAFITDKSEYFYLDSSKVCIVSKITTKGSNVDYEFFIGKGDNDNYFIDEFKNKQQVESAVAQVEKAKKEILRGASGNNYEKIKYVHDWLVDNVKYDTNNSKNTSNIYGCLVNKSVVCEGYARTFKYLLDELEIPCVLVSGIATDDDGKKERHAWNYVYLKNDWYAIDTTWDDPIIIGNGKVDENIKYKYFLKGSSTMNKDHITSGQVTKNGYEFEYPKLAVDDIS